MRIAIVGGGPGSLFMFKRLVESGRNDFEVTIFERQDKLGAGMPYSREGAQEEHITNVSDNEIPVIVQSVEEWVKVAPQNILEQFNINSANFNEYKVLPRLFFGAYLTAQFEQLFELAKQKRIAYQVNLNCEVSDIIDVKQGGFIDVVTNTNDKQQFDRVVICSGHNWPKHYEGKVDGYYDSPYPPEKLVQKLNHAVAIRGTSLTAIDALRTLSKLNGTFKEEADGKLSYVLNEDSSGFRLIMHSRNGLLPAVRFHLEDSHLGKGETLTKAQLDEHLKNNDGFVSLDYLFEENFKNRFIEHDPQFYEKIKPMNMEAFVEWIMTFRESIDPFELLKREYREAEISIATHHSVYWKEALAILSFTMNYPAKYLPAEDMLRLQKILMPLISVVIAFVPQSSCRVLMALHDAGVLEIVTVGESSSVEANGNDGIVYRYVNEKGNEVEGYYQTFVDCIGQPHLSLADFPFKSLSEQKVITQAKLGFKSQACGRSELLNQNDQVKVEADQYYLEVAGIAINDNFQVVDHHGIANNRIYMMAVPYIGGFNPDYSGLDFSEHTSEIVVKSIFT